MGSSRLLNVVYKELLVNDFIDNPKNPSKNEILWFVTNTSLSFMLVFSDELNEEEIYVIDNFTYIRDDLWNVSSSIQITVDNIVNDTSGNEVDLRPSDINININSRYLRDVIMFDIRLFYYVLKYRSCKLQLSMSDLKIKEILQNILSNCRNRLLKHNNMSLFFYLYILLRNLGYATKPYYSQLTTVHYDTQDTTIQNI